MSVHEVLPLRGSFRPLEIVRAYAARGCYVFPCHTQNAEGRCSCGKVDCERAGKHPLTKNGLNDASRAEDQIQRWLEEFSDCNWAIRTGPESGIFALDADGAEGKNTLDVWEQAHGKECLETLSATTPHGSHSIYQYPAELESQNLKVTNSVKDIAPGLDVRGLGGYILVYPSRLSDGNYVWSNPGTPIRPAPDWLLDLVVRSKERVKSQGTKEGTDEGDAIPEGKRNATLTSLAGAMRRRGMSQDSIEAALLMENTERCKPPLSRDEVQGIAGSISRYAPEPSPEAPSGSDDAMALTFVREHGANLRYTAGMGFWHCWADALWQRDETLIVFEKARLTCRAVAMAAEPGKGRRLASATTIGAVEKLARADARLAVSADCWDCDPWLLNCPGGTVDLRTGEMRAHRRDDLITKLCPVSPGDGGCPLWETFLARATDGKSELQSYLQRMAGYCATGSTREQSLFFLYGTGGNGKGVFINTITAVLEPYCAVAPIEMLLDSRNSADRHPTDLAGLRGKRLVTAVEVGKGRRWQEEKLKNLTGGDRVTARFMRGDFFEFAPVFKLLIAANHRPSLRSVDEAIRRRLHLVPFVVTIPESERDHDLGEKLKAEWPGILRWIIEGCLAWQREGLNPPAVARRATAEYFGEEDTVGRWIEEHCILGIQHDASGKALFADWKLWAEAAGEYAGSQKGFGQNLEAREGIARFRTGSERKYLGIRLRTLEDADVEIASSQPDVESEDFSA